MRGALTASCLALLLGACGTSEPEQACHDVITWTGDLTYRCTEGTSAEKEKARSDTEAGMQQALNCDKVEKIRDKDSFYGCCKSWFTDVTCEDFLKNTTAAMPACCSDQLLMSL